MDVYRTAGGKDISSPKQKIFFSLCKLISNQNDQLHYELHAFTTIIIKSLNPPILDFDPECLLHYG